MRPPEPKLDRIGPDTPLRLAAAAAPATVVPLPEGDADTPVLAPLPPDFDLLLMDFVDFLARRDAMMDHELEEAWRAADDADGSHL